MMKNIWQHEKTVELKGTWELKEGSLQLRLIEIKDKCTLIIDEDIFGIYMTDHRMLLDYSINGDIELVLVPQLEEKINYYVNNNEL